MGDLPMTTRKMQRRMKKRKIFVQNPTSAKQRLALPLKTGKNVEWHEIQAKSSKLMGSNSLLPTPKRQGWSPCRPFSSQVTGTLVVTGLIPV